MGNSSPVSVALIDTQTHVETPENVRLTFRLAGPGTRLGAYLVDLLVRAAILYGLFLVVSLLNPFLSVAGLPWGVLLLGLFLVEWGYGFAFEAFWNGQTPGKKALGLRVVKEAGYSISVYDALLRNLLRVADALPFLYGVGLVVMIGTERMQRIGDVLAGTVVVRERRARLHGTPAALSEVPSLTRDQLESPYRPPERTLDLLETFCDRRRELPDLRADEIAAI
ncbi:MAG: RDD family protein, partial [Acidobacteria bacterium]|nr:RDD family protein [Acidobacteriota bacterium]